ncbi:hypothetical protein PYW08_001531 [Mythimna loreyi]|uniref:Uncharacterized protein n=1 Tax=Mythimna loreyi TaxID=667449 RepID=A0ACC2R4H1_9NEOP|nr:hypothetical protein PYW08_001531 [Mythimna loreyi]
MVLKVLFILTCVTAAQCKLIPIACPQIREFVDGHNTRRLLVAQGKVSGQPAASEMKMMVWDEELASKASQWANKNQFQHNPDKTIKSKRFMTSDNLHRFSTNNPKPNFKPDSAVASWFGEHVNYTFGPLQASDFQQDYKIGHYTQVVWSESIYLGCAISQTFKDGFNIFIVVCNYGPRGNYEGKKPYEEGDGVTKLVCGIKNKSKCDHPYGPKCS